MTPRAANIVASGVSFKQQMNIRIEPAIQQSWLKRSVPVRPHFIPMPSDGILQIFLSDKLIQKLMIEIMSICAQPRVKIFLMIFSIRLMAKGKILLGRGER